jgi:hypothetical protein
VDNTASHSTKRSLPLLKRIIKRPVLVAVIGLLLTLLMLEIAARIVFGRSDRRFWGEQEALLQANTYNSRGLRDREYEYEKADDVHRILLLGDSVLIGFEVADDETFDYQLEWLLNNDPRTARGGIRYEVINGSHAGSSPLDEYLFLRDEGYKYDPDMVLYAYGLNEAVGLIEPSDVRYEPCTYARVDEEGNLLFDDQGELQVVKLPYDPDYVPDEPFGTHLNAWLIQSSKLYAAVIEPYLQRSRPLLRYVGNQFRKQDQMVFEHENFAVNPLPHDQGLRLDALEQIIVLTDNLAAEHGACLVNVAVPFNARVYPELAQDFYVGFDLLSDYWQYDKMDVWYSETFATHDMPYYLLSEAFIPAAETNKTLYVPGTIKSNSHWTAEGHRFAAESVYNWLIDNQLIPTNEQPEAVKCDSWVASHQTSEDVSSAQPAGSE